MKELQRTRSDVIDLLRGLVMAIMVLDHARDFFCGWNMHATDLQQTTPILFFTRWITHFCAPTFLLLAGLGAALYGQKHGTPRLRHFLWTRGLWLVLLELTVVHFGWAPDPFWQFQILQVIWATGWAMVLLAALVSLPNLALGILGLALMFLHPLLQGQLPPTLDMLLLNSGSLEPIPGHSLRVGYAILPWFGVLTFGFSLGKLWQQDRKRLTWLGIALLLAFVTMRLLHVGDPDPYVPQNSPLWSLIALLNCDKYPPSPTYLAMTLGPALLLLAWLPDQPPQWTRFLVTYGRVPLFFYVAHLWLLRYTSIPLSFLVWGKEAATFGPTGHGLSPEFPLAAAYVAWMAALVLLVRPCAWWAAKKAAGRQWWWAYL